MINILSKDTIQKIAAGEVVQRPSSIVKELVENSIDAKATRIVVEIKDGGIQLIEVSDNGEGISKDDIELAFKRHATSKLIEFNDLYNLNSLGFRGEALPSIVAVSKVTISTKTNNDTTGKKVLFENSIKINEKPIGMNTGTNIEIRDLFYNVPVRKKFLKSSITEGNYITNLMYKFAIGNYTIGITYIKDEKIIFETKENNDLKSTIIDLFSVEVVNNLIELNIKKNNFSICGYVSNNKLYKANRGMQYLYVNGRHVENNEIRNVIENAYQTIIPNGRFPSYQVFVNVNPKYLDVNIHPSKEKINITILEDILDSLREHLENITSNNFTIPNINISKQEDKSQSILFKKDNSIEELLNKFNTNNKYTHNFEETKNYNENYTINENNTASNYQNKNIDLKKDSINEFTSLIDKIDDDENIVVEEISFIDFKNNLVKYVGIIFNTYILYEDLSSNKIIIIDQHAAHERILYEKYINEINNNKLIIQGLAVPITIDLREDEYNLYLKNKDIFSKLGYDIDVFGDYTLIIRSVPVLLGIPENADFFLELLNSLMNFNQNNGVDKLTKKIITKSCKNAIKAGKPLAEIEVKFLLDKLMDCEFPYTCPHGRPILTFITKDTLEKEFLRIK